MAVPLGWRGSTVDDVRTLVDALHKHMEVEFPMDDFFLNVLGTGRLAGRLPKDLQHLNGRVVILGSYKIRQRHMDALEHIGCNGENDTLKALARLTCEIEQRGVRDCVDALSTEARGGTWCRYGCGGGADDDYQTLTQEHKAWVYLGATPIDLSHDIENVLKEIDELEQKHGGSDPFKWRWGEGTFCEDVFAADDAKKKYDNLKAKVASLQQMTSSSSDRGSSGTVLPPPLPLSGSSGSQTADRERSRSPRREETCGV